MKITKISAHISDTNHYLKVEEFTGTVLNDNDGEGDYIQLRDDKELRQQCGCMVHDLGEIKTDTSTLGIGAWGDIYIWTDNPLGPNHNISELKRKVLKATVDRLNQLIEKSAKAFINSRELQKLIP